MPHRLQPIAWHQALDLGQKNIQRRDVIGDFARFIEQNAAIGSGGREPAVGQADALDCSRDETPGRVALIREERELYARRAAVDDQRDGVRSHGQPPYPVLRAGIRGYALDQPRWPRRAHARDHRGRDRTGA